ncbi:DUF1349 domain-containing protein [Sphingobacterium bambusae]|nr:DUF1349 domain-containing protein [Sphingobacterium bambusae]WPL48558.1 DUF1349 domain-containing protein [Sphingobacterium bambusae]
MNKQTFSMLMLCTTALMSCNQQENKSAHHTQAVADSLPSRLENCDVTVSEIYFSKSLNDAKKLVSIDDQGQVIFKVGEKRDFFSDPDGKLSNNTAPILLKEIDNEQPFTFSAKVIPQFTENGTYDAGVLYVYANDRLYQKHCFEQDEAGQHRVVTVKTDQTSDDSNHEVIQNKFVYLKLSSDGQTIASYYSIDNKNWKMARLYKNNYPKRLYVGISAQCPLGKGSTSIFENVTFTNAAVKDFRRGI